MATTSEGEESGRIASFFRERVLPLAARMRAARGDLLPLAPDPRLASYFTPVARRTMQPADFARPSGLSPETLAPKLCELWAERGIAELAALAPELARLSGELSLSAEEEGEVSPFVYVMY